MKRSVVMIVAIAVAIAWPPGTARASEDNVETERTLSEILQEKRLEDAKARGDVSGRDTTVEEELQQLEREQKTGKKESSRALVPQISFSPEKGAGAGFKFTDRDIRGLTIDLAGLAAMKGQFKGHGSIVAPDLLDGWLILYGYGLFAVDPRKLFFSLGNNDVGPDEISRHGYKHGNGRLAAAVRLSSRFTAVASGEYEEWEILRGARKNGIPSTRDIFPDLVGIDGGRVSPVSLSLIFDDRDDVTRPTRGWNVIAKGQRVDRALGNNFEFTRGIFEASYLYPLLTRRQVIGVRVGGEYIDTKRRQTPFFSLSSLGGGDDMRGYFLDRFVGQAKVIAGGEYRLKLLDFNFFDIWNVKIDGVAFGDAGRVFLARDDMASTFGEDEATLPKTNDKMRYSYGGGVRFALGQAILARVDVGFSDEEQGLVYLVFGHTF